jgi:hypothetical protein
LTAAGCSDLYHRRIVVLLDALQKAAETSESGFVDGIPAHALLDFIAELRSTRTAVPGPDQVVVDREALATWLAASVVGHINPLEVAPAFAARERLAAALSPDTSTETP